MAIVARGLSRLDVLAGDCRDKRQDDGKDATAERVAETDHGGVFFADVPIDAAMKEIETDKRKHDCYATDGKRNDPNIM